MKSKTLVIACVFLLLGLFACTPETEEGSDSESLTTAPPTETTAPSPTATQPMPTPSPPPTSTPPPTEASQPLTEETLANMTYSGIYEEPVQLTGGSFEGEPFTEGSALRPTVTLYPLNAFGDLDGDGVEDAVALLVESSGGSGSFFYLAAVLNRDGEPDNVATTIIDDRAGPETLAIVDGQIILERKVRAESDPLCCPSLEARVVYELLQDNELAEVSFELTSVDVTGQVAVRGADGTVELPAGSRVIVHVEDTGIADAPAQLLGEQIIEDAETLPLSYEIALEPATLEDAVQATVSVRVETRNETLLYTSDTANLVTIDEPHVVVEVIPVNAGDGNG